MTWAVNPEIPVHDPHGRVDRPSTAFRVRRGLAGSRGEDRDSKVFQQKSEMYHKYTYYMCHILHNINSAVLRRYV